MEKEMNIVRCRKNENNVIWRRSCES